MDIYSFINSKDVAAYCREINKVWTPFEMAVIIGRCRRITLAERHAAWRELMANYPDMPTPKNSHHDSYDSFHQKLTEMINYEEHLIELFTKPCFINDIVYMYKIWCKGEFRNSDGAFSYDGIEGLLTDAREMWEREETPDVRVTARFIGDDTDYIEAGMDYDSNLFWVSSAHPQAESYNVEYDIFSPRMFTEDFFIDIPVPFKRGDILTIQSHSPGTVKREQPFVLYSLISDNEKVLEQCLRGERGDGSDLSGWGYFVGDNGLVYGDHVFNYDCFEYYRGKLEGKDSMLHYISLFLKDEIDLTTILAVQAGTVLKHSADTCINSNGCYIPEHLLAENRPANENTDEGVQQ